MKITVVANNKNYCVKRLVEEAKNKNIETEVVDFDSLESFMQYEGWGDVIIWRNSKLTAHGRDYSVNSKKVIFDKLKDKKILNLEAHKNISISNKFYQQKILTTDEDLKGYAVETFCFKNINEIESAVNSNRLHLPFIEKPTYGSKGQNVRLIRNLAEVTNVDERIYQNFIPNNGDYRVICLGGKIIGVIKRIRKDGEHRNNISTGAEAELVTDRQELKKVKRIALLALKKFKLDLCGIDIIKDESTEKYYFLEINTMVWWEGFEKVSNINLSEEIINYCVESANRDSNDTHEIVRDFYLNNQKYLGESNFHFFSRMFLWTQEDIYYKKLDAVLPSYLGSNPEQISNKISEILNDQTQRKNKDARSLLLITKYPKLNTYTKVLFKFLFAKKIYDLDITNEVLEHISVGELSKYVKVLDENIDDLLLLSTFGLNYLYLLNLFLEDLPGETGHSIDIKRLLDVSKKYKDNSTVYFNYDDHVKIYFYTHCIINASEFYSSKVDDQDGYYLTMLKECEEIIENNYFNLKLDTKFEFLVCCKLLNYNSRIANLIKQEADKSFSQMGNFLVDKYNENTGETDDTSPEKSEHRNVLFIMSKTELNH